MTTCGQCQFGEECVTRGLTAPSDGTDCGWFVRVMRPDQPQPRVSDAIAAAQHAMALRWHLEFNHYPPAPEFFDVCEAAIQAASIGEPEQEIELPEGITYRDYGQSCPASALIETFHLDFFIDTQED